MKFSASNLKNMNYKQLLLNHGEKFAVGLAGLIAVIALCVTTWTPYQKTPKSIEKKANTADTTIRQATWPQSEQTNFPSRDTLKKKIKVMEESIDLAQFTSSIDLSFTLAVKEKLHTNPIFLPVTQLIVSPIVMAIPTKIEVVEESEPEVTQPDDTPRFRGEDDESEPEKTVDAERITEGRGVRVNAVRGIFNIKQQAEYYAKALNCTLADAHTLVESNLWDAIIERQVSTDHGKTWGQWKIIDRNQHSDQKTFIQYALDVVDPGLTHRNITDPLPERLMMEWGMEATHGEIEDFKESSEGKKLRQKIEKLAEDFIKKENLSLKSARHGPSRSRPGILLLRDLWKEKSTLKTKFLSYVEKYFVKKKVKNVDGFVKEADDLVSANGTYYLFRYFDADVQPGHAYQYRVKLQFHNPNFDKPAALLVVEHQDSVTKEFQTSPYSEPTEPAFIPNDVNYFIATDKYGIEQIDAKSLLTANVNIVAYKWAEEFGTTIKGFLKEVQVGQPLDGTDEKTTVFNPGTIELLEKERTHFHTGATLLDINQKQEISNEAAQELNVQRSSRKPVHGKILVINGRGQLKLLIPGDAQQTWKETYYQGLLSYANKLVVDGREDIDDEEYDEEDEFDE